MTVIDDTNSDDRNPAGSGTVRPSSDQDVMKALSEASRDRGAARAISQARPFPRITDTFEGFEVEVETDAPGERRFVEIVMSAHEGVTATTYDTAMAGTRDVDQAIVRRQQIHGSRALVEYLAVEGMAVEVTVDGKPGALDFERGSAVGFYEADGDGQPKTQKGYLIFGRGDLAAVMDGEVHKATDWHDMAAYLEGRGVRIEASSFEPAPAPAL